MRGAGLTDHEAAALRGAELTYPSPGATTAGTPPPAYRLIDHERLLGHGRERFDRAARTVMSWEMHRRAGLTVRASSRDVVEGSVAVIRIGTRHLGLDAPVRVVYVVDEPGRQGFAYGTLAGHPERGEEAFVVELRDDESVVFTISAFSQPATRLARLGGPVSRGVQAFITERYLRAV
ncbi:DUF1990 family protein [Nocardioides baculatus]|uniref:DUF1990 domain-containing protein n=1 Tax=Nocardioides baculatus TaxID=2801337 RepID=A0ABS1L9N3_9ACTN|nr:DUF1990 domain-containing protein [Nocardioides baculatus]MBL0748396.1 DUF1990 domain-containing protein [Nocardioides baculatus]